MGHWYGQDEQLEGMPSDLLDLDQTVDRLEKRFGIITTTRIFGTLTRINWGPANWAIDGTRYWSRSQVDAWVLGWKFRPKVIGLKFKEPPRRPGFDREAPPLQWAGEGGVEFLVRAAQND